MEEILCYVLVTLTKNLSAFYKFMKTHQFQFLNDFSIWESPDPNLLKKNQSQITVDPNYFKNHEEPVIYRNEPIKNHQFNGQLFYFFNFLWELWLCTKTSPLISSWLLTHNP